MGDRQQPNLNTKATAQNTFDAIVVGSGISGGWAAKELCEKGLKTLLLERGRNVEHIKDYTTAFKAPWQFEHRLENTEKIKTENPIQGIFSNEADRQFFVSDKEHPYIQETNFNWLRGYQVGGRSLTWGRQCYRLSDLDFEANMKDGFGVDWPIRYKDIEQWYSYVEGFVGISGSAEGLPHLPDGNFLPAQEMNCIERVFAQKVKEKLNRPVIIGRTANLTKGINGRQPCQNRNLCSRGCPFTGYFSSNGVTIPTAMATGNLTLRPFSIVAEVIYDPNTRKASGVRIVDSETNKSEEYYAKIVFLNASTIGTANILLNSVSRYFPQGFGNSSGQVGHNLMDHHFKVGAAAMFEGHEDQYYKGRRANGIYIPRFRNLDEKSKRSDYVRGFGYQCDGERMGWRDKMGATGGFGKNFKEELTKPGPWTIWAGSWGECLPYFENKVELDRDKKDKWGVPVPKISFEFKENEYAMRKDMQASAIEMLSAAGAKSVSGFDYKAIGGDCIHEMGTARMGRDPKTSVLNANNQMHDVKNVFITDGSCMTSSACQNPSLTYMALTARAADFAVSELKKGNL